MRPISERTADMTSAIKAAMRSVSNSIRAAMPGIVESYDPDTQTVTVRPAIREIVTIDNTVCEGEIPLLPDVPVVMPRAGGYCLLFVPKKGDECLVVFADMCIDAWWQSGEVSSQADMRRHDLSDAFAVFGCWSQAKKPVMPTSGVRLQNDAGTAGIEIDGTSVNAFGTFTTNKKSLTAENIDSMLTPGNYWISNAVITGGTLPSDLSGTWWAVLEVVSVGSADSSVRIQRMTMYSTCKQYTRMWANSQWYGWNE